MPQTATNVPHLSFEFFPPRSPEANARLATTRRRLAAFGPEFFSVTFGAGGSTRELTLETVLELKRDTGIDSAPHISCIGFTLDGIREVLAEYRAAGITRLVTLRGDMPSGSTGFGELRYANELVEFIRRESGDHFHVSVAAYPEVHPQASGAKSDLDNFQRKVEAGANDAITQYFYNADAYFRFVDAARARGIDIDIIPGIMPITNFSSLKRFSDMCGAEIPRWILKRLQDFGDDRSAIQAFGVDVTTHLCAQLLAGEAPGLHFYAMNQADAPSAILAGLGVAAAGSPG